jgi:hypothetical protein
LLVKDPKKRYTAEKALEHPWVKGEGFELLKHNSSYINLLKEIEIKKNNSPSINKKEKSKSKN